MDLFVDGGLLQKAREGDKESIRQLCGLTERHLRQLAYLSHTGNNDVVQYMGEILRAIESGHTPDVAFRWRRAKAGRPPKHAEFLKWNIASNVDNLVKDLGREDAIRLVGEAANMDGSPSGTVSKIYDKWRDRDDRDLPSWDIFPMSDALEKTGIIEDKIKALLPQFLAKSLQIK